MSKNVRNSGPRCASCGRPFQPRQMRDGNWSQTCGQTACVALHNRKKASNTSNSYRFDNRQRPQNAW